MVVRFTEWDMGKEIWMFPSQESDRPSRGREDKVLYRPGYGLQERGTHQGWIRSGSLYVKASKHPGLTTAAVATVGVAIWFLATSVMQNY